MLTLRNKKLSAENFKITSADTILTLNSDIDATFLGVLELSNGARKVCSFNKIDNDYQARLIIDIADLPTLKESKFYLVLIDSLLNEKTNMIKPKFDIELIKQNIKVSASKELEELQIKIKELESVVASLAKGKIIDQLNIKNKDYIEPGMIPVAIDKSGNCVMSYPFASHITSVNGRKAANGVVEVDSSVIKYKLGNTVEQIIDNHANALISIANALKTISDNQKEIRKHLDELDIRLTQHINDGII